MLQAATPEAELSLLSPQHEDAKEDLQVCPPSATLMQAKVFDFHAKHASTKQPFLVLQGLLLDALRKEASTARQADREAAKNCLKTKGMKTLRETMAHSVRAVQLDLHSQKAANSKVRRSVAGCKTSVSASPRRER